MSPEQLSQNKILPFEDLVRTVQELKKSGKSIVQSLGVFDMIHPGVIKHLVEAKKQGDVLVVTVIKDKDVRRGPGRPVFGEALRAENVAFLGMVDFVALADDERPYESVQRIQPHVFAKGAAFNERDKQIHRKIFEEERELCFGKSKIYETNGFSYTSSEIVNRFLAVYPEETKVFLRDFKKRYSFKDIADHIDALKTMKVLIVGDGIIDEYHYVDPMGKAGKSNLVVNKYIDHEVFAGGAFAIANHTAGVCDQVHLVCLLGQQDSRESFVRDNLKPNVTSKFFLRDNGPTTIKKRYVHQYLNQKLFEVNFIQDVFVDDGLEAQIVDYLQKIVPQYDLVLVSDFGHGFISQNIFAAIERNAKVLAINTQTNAANAGYNLITKYHSPNYVCLDEQEVRLAAQSKYDCVDRVVEKIKATIKAENMIVTLGKKGSVGLNKNNEVNRTPIFSTRVVDTIGAGDAFFAFTAPCFARGVPLDLVSFIGNAVGALAVQIVCNKKAVEKYELLEFIDCLLR
jgi:bifunctional ADP-heptose synthase (sugar kinase/adenylyltransferase)